MTYTPREFSLDDLDIAILKALPAEGSKHGKYLNDGRTVKALVKALDPTLTSAIVSGRLNALKYNNLVVGVKGATANEFLYQATPAGKKAVSAVKAVKAAPEQEEAQAS